MEALDARLRGHDGSMSFVIPAKAGNQGSLTSCKPWIGGSPGLVGFIEALDARLRGHDGSMGSVIPAKRIRPSRLGLVLAKKHGFA